MSNAITLPGSGAGLINRESLVASLNNVAMAMPTSGSGLPFLKMDSKNGDFFFGQEETQVPKKSVWAANPLSIMQGWVCWDPNDMGSAPVQEVMVSITRPLPTIDSLPVLGMSKPHKKTGKIEQLVYVPQRSIEFTCVESEEDEDVGITVEYKQSSGGAMKLFGKLINAILAKAQAGDDIVPLGSFNFETYPNKTYGGTTYNPLFEIVEWRTADDKTPPAEAAKAAAIAPAGKLESATIMEPSADEDAELAKEYEAAAASEAPASAAPRRRVRR